LNFAQPAFPVFMALVLVGYWSLRRARLQNPFLLGVSCIFYGWVHPWFVSLLLVSIVVDYGAALGMVRSPHRKKAFLWLSVCTNLTILGLFKYLDFFIESFGLVLQSLGLGTGPAALGIMLPVGISFFTFQSMSYTIDVYRGKLQARSRFIDVATYVALFPQLVAGPIERARNLLPQLETDRTFSWERLGSGLGLLLWGMVQKICVADTLGLYVDRIYTMEDPNAALIAAGTFGFMMQILADFSGYTDIARGAARMMGFELMENFYFPYGSSSPSQMWKRWHISLSSWIHEYLYIPLGGNRHGPRRAATAACIALFLAGLWHGASWNFLVWGLYNAGVLLVWRWTRGWVPESIRQTRGAHGLAVALMFCSTWAGLVLFRQPSAEMLLAYASLSPLEGTLDQFILAAIAFFVSLAAGVFLLLGGLGRRRWLPALVEQPWSLPLRTSLWSVALICIFLFARDTARDFVYFQF
jgi:alginate O-acetyltransferase complex protein AlgI